MTAFTRRPGCRLAGALSLWACSACGFDDLGTRPCESDFDCYQLGRVDAELTACPRCSEGICVAGAPMAPRSQSLIEADIDALSVTGEPPPRLLLVGTGDGVHYAQGWQLQADWEAPPPHQIEYAYGDAFGCPLFVDDVGVEGSPRCSLSEHVSVWISDDVALGASVNSAHCAKQGQLRVGLSDQAGDPFELAVDNGRAELKFGVDGPMPSECLDWKGATAPAVAALCMGTEPCSEALVVWLEAPKPNPGEANETAPLRAAQLEVSVAPLRLRTREACEGLGEGFTHVAPRVLASAPEQVEGYLVAHANAAGLVLTALDAGRPCEVRDVATIETSVHAIALSKGPSRKAAQRVLVAWTSGDGYPERMEVATVRWDKHGVIPERRFTLRSVKSPGEISDPPGVAYTREGFFLRDEPGGWALTWAERKGNDSAVFAARIGQEGTPIGASERIGETGRLPFVIPSHRSPFAFGHVLARDGASRLTSLHCE